MLKRIALSGIVVMTLAGCAGQETKPEQQTRAAVEPVSEAEKAAGEQGGLPIEQSQGAGVEVIPITEVQGTAAEEAGLSAEEQATDGKSVQLAYEPIVYFDYDSDTISEQGRQVLKYYAEKLAAQPDVRVRLEGHTDERGSPEYNLALGERRAKAVKEVLVLYGVAPERIEVISYGETHPAVEGHNEAAWAKNRRVELVFIK